MSQQRHKKKSGKRHSGPPGEKGKAVLGLVDKLAHDAALVDGTIALATHRPAQQPGDTPNLLVIFRIDGLKGAAAREALVQFAELATFLTVYDVNGNVVATVKLEQHEQQHASSGVLSEADDNESKEGLSQEP
jgi:hypothetical protein